MQLISFNREEEILNANEGIETDTGSEVPSKDTPTTDNKVNKAQAIINRVWEDKALETARKLLSRWTIDNNIFTEVQTILNK